MIEKLISGKEVDGKSENIEKCINREFFSAFR